jgi:hypothetical protein
MGKKKAAGKRDISNDAHTDKQRASNPPVGFGHWTWAVSKETADLPGILAERGAAQTCEELDRPRRV